MRTMFSALLVMSAALVAGCDQEAPPAPFLELLPSTTQATHVWVEGTTEASALVSLSRSPPFTSDEEAPAAVEADALSGRFRLRVPLAIGEEQTLSVTAQDAADNVSLPAEVVIQQDDAPPAPPFVEPTLTQTTADHVLLVGTTEPGATLHIARAPAFAADEHPVVSLDDNSGAFVLNAPLALDETNVFSLTATGALDTTSTATEVTVVQLPTRISALLLEVDARDVDADAGLLAGRLLAHNSDGAPSLAGLEVQVSTSNGVDDTVVLDAAGRGVFALAEMREAGLFTVTATAALPATDGATASASASFTVHPGAPASAVLTFSDGTAAGNPLQTTAGSSVEADVTVEDAHGNAIAAPAVALTSSTAGVAISGTTLVALTRAQTVNVSAHLEGGLSVDGTVEVQAAAPHEVLLHTSDDVVTAGDPVEVLAQAIDAFGNLAAETPVVVEDVPIFHPGLPDEDAQDIAGVMTTTSTFGGTLTPVTAGRYTIAASLASGATAEVALEVVPSTTSAFDLRLNAVGPFAAGDVIPFEVDTQDAYDNTTTEDLIVGVDTVHADAVIDAFGVGQLRVTKAGTFVLSARTAGGSLSDSETVVVEADAASGINLELTLQNVAEGGRTAIRVSDAYGNPIAVADVSVTVDGVAIASHPTVSLSGALLTFSTTGDFVIEASLIADPTVSDSELVAVAPVVDTQPPHALVTSTFPSTTVPLQGFIEVTAEVSDNRALAEASIEVQFGDLGICNASSSSVLLAGQTSATLVVPVQAPGCALPGDAIALYVRAADQAGNVGYSSPWTALSVAIPPGFDITANSAFTSTLVAFGDRIQRGDQPLDVTSTALTGVHHMSMFNNDRIVVAFPDRNQEDLRDAFDNRVDVAEPTGIARTETGELFIASNADLEVALVDGNQLQQNGWINFGTSPGRLSWDASGAAPMLCVTLPAAGEVRCYRNAVTNPELAGTWSGLSNPTSASLLGNRLWVVQQNCQVAFVDVAYDLAVPTQPSLTFGAPNVVADVGNDCPDIAALDSGAAAVLHRGGQEVLHVDDVGLQDIIADQLDDPRGIDFDGGSLFLLDRGLEAVFQLDGSF